ncbi:MAG: pantoate--beta-alanine ligase [Kiritimatiellaeota bacterium]|nr:pantoate--beta-alanine ligase [Kiritimatiellota bacterium]
MNIFHTPHEMTAWSQAQRRSGKRIGFVPTMGYLHAGHLSLVAEAQRHADAIALSIFVNPTQFGPHEDFATYPRDEARDLALCREAGVAAVFLPAPAAMYAPDASVSVDESALQNGLCGARRPGHFRGVCTVVAKLFNIVLPDVAVFGQKDFQQAAVIRRMVRDLNFPVTIITAPTLREPDGLAMSSRNVHLNAKERQQALGLSRALASAADALRAGETSADTLRQQMRDVLEQHGLRVDYAEIADAETLSPVTTATPGNVALIAAHCGNTRLIDNRVL